MSLRELNRMTYNIAEEALTISDISTYIRGRIEALKNLFTKTAGETAKGLTGSLVDLKQEEVKLTKQQEKFLKKIDTLRYVDLVKQTVFVPPGMSGTYTEYLDGMKSFVSLAVESKKTVDEFVNFISKMMESADARRDVSYIANRTRELRRERDEIIKIQNDHIAKNSKITQVPYEHALRNNSEWKEILTSIVRLGEMFKETDPESVLKDIQTAVVLVDRFSAQVKVGAYKELTNESVSKIADYIYAVAQMMEIYSIAHFRMLSVTTAVNDTMEKLQKL